MFSTNVGYWNGELLGKDSSWGTFWEETFVSNGDKVETKQSIGKVNSDQGKTVIQFEIRKGQEAEPMNPSYWLYNAR